MERWIIRINFRTNDKKHPTDDRRIHLPNEHLHMTWLRKIRFVASQARSSPQVSHVNPILMSGHK